MKVSFTPAKRLDLAGDEVAEVGFFVEVALVSGFQMNLVNILAAIIAANVLSAIPTSASPSANPAAAGSPMRSTAWTWNGGPLHRPRAEGEAFRLLARQCKATFQFDRIGAKLIDDMGAESLMWGSDYLHGDGVWPNSEQYIKEQFAEVSPEVTRMITCTNAGKFYGLIN